MKLLLLCCNVMMDEVTPGGEGGTKLTITTIGFENVKGVDISAHILLFEMAHVTGSGRKDLN